MARLNKNRRCIICGESGVLLWSLDNQQKVSVTYLCETHAAPLDEIMRAAGPKPPDEQVPLPDRVEEPAVPTRGKPVPMAPLNWTPPGDSQVAS